MLHYTLMTASVLVCLSSDQFDLTIVFYPRKELSGQTADDCVTSSPDTQAGLVEMRVAVCGRMSLEQAVMSSWLARYRLRDLSLMGPYQTRVPLAWDTLAHHFKVRGTLTAAYTFRNTIVSFSSP